MKLKLGNLLNIESRSFVVTTLVMFGLRKVQIVITDFFYSLTHGSGFEDKLINLVSNELVDGSLPAM